MSDNLKKGLMAVITVAVAIAAIYSIKGFFGEEDYVARANTRVLMDSETGDLFPFELTENMPPYPHVNPKTGDKTLFPVEWCYARECGAKGGTPVILNTWLGKEGPTYCPNCGALVRFHNPKPETANKDEQ